MYERETHRKNTFNKPNNKKNQDNSLTFFSNLDQIKSSCTYQYAQIMKKKTHL